MIQSSVIIGLAYILDLALGDPAWLPHPVRWIGYFAEKLEVFLRGLIRNKRLAGVIFAIIIIGGAYLGCFAVIHIASSFNRYLSIILSIFFIYTSLAIKDLRVEAMAVYRALEKGRIELAREKLSLIVGRDTKNLSAEEIIRATVETVSENIVDGIISPLFYAFSGGPALALAYKAANTLDSMVGYRNDKYKDFGWASAKIDDLANFIPARLSVFLLPAASLLLGLDAGNSFKVALRDGNKNPSPNSGIPEAAVAGALGVKLGGLNHYNSKACVKPFIGIEKNALSLNHIKECINIAYVSSLLSIILIGTIFIVIFLHIRH